ncbi:MAG TPA: hypothetical protein D7H99_05090 [Candidatus Poseidoniales archaeon]|nr:MAG TPA: hypothetical protein D7H99_05090 [Candidatus Poseidoniales archaeon]HII58319.1 hypothetical protein [Candidatus Poseidoniaceae archaeon]
MVDWNLDTESRVKVTHEARQQKVSRKSRVNNSRPSRKSRPLVQYSNQHLLHSGAKRKSTTKVTIRKAKRDASGNVMISA